MPTRRPRRSVPLVFAALAVAAGCAAPATAPASGSSAPAFRPVAEVDHIMDGIVIPGSQVIFDAVVYSNGELVQAPKTDDDWFRIRMQALAVAEAGNLLLIPPRVKDAEWVGFSQAMTERAAVAANAAEAKDLDALLDAGSGLYEACTACHAKYLMEQP